MIPAGLIPNIYRNSWCVAGGWAACPSLAGDKDVWIMDPNPLDGLLGMRKAMLDHLKDEGFTFTEEGQEQNQHGYPPSFGIIKIAAITEPDASHPIHLLGTLISDPLSLIGTFDISTHQIAITHDGNVVKGSDWTPINQPPRVISVNQGKPTTPARMSKLIDRYRPRL